VIVVSADPKTQRARVLAREGMTEQKFAAIRARQMSEADKRRRADHVIVTDRPLEKTRGEVMALVKRLRKANPSDGG
jgi:dephospho-CoA kinase